MRQEKSIKDKIKFPLYNISLSKATLKEDYNSIEFLFLEDVLYISKDDYWFKKYIQHKRYIDMRGKVIYIIDKVSVKKWYSFFWKRHCYEYVFKESDETITFLDFKKDLLEKLTVLNEDKILLEWEEKIKKAKDFEDCIS